MERFNKDAVLQVLHGCFGVPAMKSYHIRRGAYLVESGAVFSVASIEVPDGCTLHDGLPPEEASIPPDTINTWRFNMETLAWEKEPPGEETLWARVRYQRDEMLAACDWLTVRAQERGEPVPQAWLDYRQALRDITQQSDPENIVWPQAPEG